MPTYPQRPRKSGVIVPQQVKWHGRLAARAIWLTTKMCGATVRFKLTDQSGWFGKTKRRTEPVIFCLWHNRLALCLPLREIIVLAQEPNRGMAALVSASRDGGLLARVLELAGIQPVRGSSSRRGSQALLELKSWAERGYDLTITPDGPRGPRYVVQDGVIGLAQITGCAIVPVSYHLNPKWSFKSWDRFQLPLPLARCRATIGEPLRVPSEAEESEREHLRQQLEARLKGITED